MRRGTRSNSLPLRQRTDSAHQDEAERLDMLHTVIVDVALSKRLVTDESILGGPSRPQVLDVGYGTGIWAYEMALQYPNVDVVGIDLYNNQPERDDEAVANASFLTPVDFTQSDWGFREGTFDLIHMSQLCGCVPDWAQHYARVLRLAARCRYLRIRG